MLLSVWNYLRGYVIIDVYGFSAERFINLCARHGVFLWDVTRQDYGAVRMGMSVKGFFQTKDFARKTKCKIKIRKRVGLPFLANKYRSRWGFFAGALFFAAALYFLSSFLWVVEIPKTEMVNNAVLTDFLAEKGVYAGAFKFGLNPKKAEKSVLLEFPAVSWVNISVKGTRATVTLTEVKPKVTLPEKTTCDIVADTDAVIVSVAVKAGTPKVKAGDVVRAGSRLVSGELISGVEGGNAFAGVRSRGSRGFRQNVLRIFVRRAVYVRGAYIHGQKDGAVFAFAHGAGN
ncbi:hypothetical protein FACS189490_11260 [Clostridia bacterium]|nr:hypothetical protein FACS189490_11260 [Clostridia bacterium]